MIVIKFGGTSVQDAQAIGRVISIVEDRLAEKPVVVVSALARVTRLLVKIAEEAKNEPETVKSAPHNTPIGRVDDVLAAKHPVVTYKQMKNEE